jgi:hypothetical protein
MQRNNGGAWCGYVAISPEHPLFNKEYNDTITVSEEIAKRPIDIDKVGAINLLCATLGDNDIEKREIEVVLAFDVHGGLTWSNDHHANGKPDGNWWFGFDCSHAGDYSPKYDYNIGGGIYRTQEYVIDECRELAKQLTKIGEVHDCN